jgi:hypothetical protein
VRDLGAGSRLWAAEMAHVRRHWRAQGRPLSRADDLLALWITSRLLCRSLAAFPHGNRALGYERTAEHATALHARRRVSRGNHRGDAEGAEVPPDFHRRVPRQVSCRDAQDPRYRGIGCAPAGRLCQSHECGSHLATASPDPLRRACERAATSRSSSSAGDSIARSAGRGHIDAPRRSICVLASRHVCGAGNSARSDRSRVRG